MLSVWPDVFVTTSASVFPQFREYERFTTAAINGFVGLKVRNYLDRLRQRMADRGMPAELRLMRSNGGVVTGEVAAQLPATLLLSGPAAGVLAGAHAGRSSGQENLITFDVGGTSADIGIVTPRGITEATARDTFIAGYPILVPMIDVHTVGAGGGSIAYVDPGGAFRVGPAERRRRAGPRVLRPRGRRGDRHRCERRPRTPSPRVLPRRRDADRPRVSRPRPSSG